MAVEGISFVPFSTECINGGAAKTSDKAATGTRNGKF